MRNQKTFERKKMKEVYKRDLGFLEAALACGANVPGNYSNGHSRSLFNYFVKIIKRDPSSVIVLISYISYSLMFTPSHPFHSNPFDVIHDFK